jgi:hypothetical protein
MPNHWEPVPEEGCWGGASVDGTNQWHEVNVNELHKYKSTISWRKGVFFFL